MLVATIHSSQHYNTFNGFGSFLGFHSVWRPWQTQSSETAIQVANAFLQAFQGRGQQGIVECHQPRATRAPSFSPTACPCHFESLISFSEPGLLFYAVLRTSYRCIPKVLHLDVLQHCHYLELYYGTASVKINSLGGMKLLCSHVGGHQCPILCLFHGHGRDSHGSWWAGCHMPCLGCWSLRYGVGTLRWLVRANTAGSAQRQREPTEALQYFVGLRSSHLMPWLSSESMNWKLDVVLSGDLDGLLLCVHTISSRGGSFDRR